MSEEYENGLLEVMRELKTMKKKSAQNVEQLKELHEKRYKLQAQLYQLQTNLSAEIKTKQKLQYRTKQIAKKNEELDHCLNEEKINFRLSKKKMESIRTNSRKQKENQAQLQNYITQLKKDKHNISQRIETVIVQKQKVNSDISQMNSFIERMMKNLRQSEDNFSKQKAYQTNLEQFKEGSHKKILEKQNEILNLNSFHHLQEGQEQTFKKSIELRQKQVQSIKKIDEALIFDCQQQKQRKNELTQKLKILQEKIQSFKQKNKKLAKIKKECRQNIEFKLIEKQSIDKQWREMRQGIKLSIQYANNVISRQQTCTMS